MRINNPYSTKNIQQTDTSNDNPTNQRGWHDRLYLPHYDDSEKTQHVNFHLADSLPVKILQQLKDELKNTSPDTKDIIKRKRIDEYIDSGYGSCILSIPDIAEMAQNTLLFFDEKHYNIYAWVIMPNYVHVLFRPLENWTVPKILASWKKFTARQICDFFRNTANQINNQNNYPNPVWYHEYYDRYIRDEQHFNNVIEYIHNNPVKAGLVNHATEWMWSSAYTGKSGDLRSREIKSPCK